MWLDTSTVDSDRRSRTTWRISTICTGSSPLIGSSRITRRGLWMIGLRDPDALLEPVAELRDHASLGPLQVRSGHDDGEARVELRGRHAVDAARRNGGTPRPAISR
jgi:hypothetical protein